MSTLNCPEEVILAKKMISIHPWADKVSLQEQVEKQIQ